MTLGSPQYLVDLLPAILIRNTQLGPVVQQQLTAAGIAPHHRRVEQWGQPPAVLVVGRPPKIQERLGREGGQSEGSRLLQKGALGPLPHPMSLYDLEAGPGGLWVSLAISFLCK